MFFELISWLENVLATLMYICGKNVVLIALTSVGISLLCDDVTLQDDS